MLSSEGSGGRSGGEVSTQVLLEAVSVILEDFVVLDEGKRLSVVRVGLVQQETEADVSKSEVSNCDLVTSDVLASVGLESLLDGGNPDGQVLKPVLLENGFLLLIGFEVVLEVSNDVVLDSVNGGIDFPCELGVVGVVAVGAAEVSEDGPRLD